MSILKNGWLWLAVVLLIEFTICYAFLSYAVPKAKPEATKTNDYGVILKVNNLSEGLEVRK